MEENDIRKELEEIRKETKGCKEGISEITTILKGDPSSDKPEGVVYMVFRNTEFRKIAIKVLWFLFTSVVLILINEAFNLV